MVQYTTSPWRGPTAGGSSIGYGVNGYKTEPLCTWIKQTDFFQKSGETTQRNCLAFTLLMSDVRLEEI